MAYNVGQVVEALFKDGEWYPAEVKSVTPTGYMIEWFDGSGRARATEDKLRPVAAQRPHRFKAGDSVLYEAEPWTVYTITGLNEVGYFVRWQDEEAFRILEEHAWAFTPGEVPPVGTRVLGYFEDDGSWYAAKLTAVFPDRVELRWEDGSGSATVATDQVVPYPTDSEGGAAAGAAVSPDADNLGHYLTRRTQTKEVANDRTEVQFCPACGARHEVLLMSDKLNDTQFWVCNAEGTLKVVVQRRESGLTALSVQDFITRYPAISTPKPSLLGALIASSELEVSLSPPFVTVKIGKRR